MTDFDFNPIVTRLRITRPMYIWSRLVCLTSLGILSHAVPSQAQSITPARDDTGTVIHQNQDRILIHGGRQSLDKQNLFHSFESFGLDSHQVAEFLSAPDTRNILGRVMGGSASIINGLLQVSGSDANLFLMNPAGIVFGANAQLDLSGSFTATTATGIGFGDHWFNAIGENDYDILLGNPNQFAFAERQPGSLFNEGNLHVSSGHRLMLLGGTVVNTGTLAAPEGLVTVAAIPGEQLVRIRHEDMLLSLDLATLPTDSPAASPLPFTPLSLPELLTGSDAQYHANTIRFNDDGSIHIGDVDQADPLGTTLGTTINAAIAPTQPGTVITSGSIDVSPAAVGNSSTVDFSEAGAIAIVGDRIATISATLNADATHGGGSIRVGGNQRGADGLPTATYTVVDASSILSADALLDGNGGEIVVWADEVTTVLGSITATGGTVAGDGGFVEVSGNTVHFTPGPIDLTAPQGDIGTLLIDPIDIRIVDGNGANDTELLDGQIFQTDGTGEFTISASELETLSGTADIVLEAKEHITIDNLADDFLEFEPGPGSIRFTADADHNNSGDIRMHPSDAILSAGRDLTLSGHNLSIGSIDASGSDRGGRITLDSSGSITVAQGLESAQLAGTGGNIDITAVGDISVGQNSFSESISVSGGIASGNITVTSQTGSVMADGEISSASTDGKAGHVDITAYDGVILGVGSDQAVVESFGLDDGGNITITTTVGDIDASQGSLNSISDEGAAGRVRLEAGGNITVGTDDYGDAIYAGGTRQQGGDIWLISHGDTIALAGELDSISEDGSAGNILVQAAGDIILGSDAAAFDAIGSAVSSTGGQTSGSIRITSETGIIDASAGGLNSFSENGRAGSVKVDAAGDVMLGADLDGVAIASYGLQQGGQISINSQQGRIQADQGLLTSASIEGSAGAISLAAQAGVTVADIVSAGDLAGGDVTIISQQGGIDVSAGSISSIAEAGTAGQVIITAQGDVTVGNNNPIATVNQLDLFLLDLEDDGISSIRSQGFTQGGRVQVTSEQGAIAIAGIIDSISDNGTAGDVTVTAQTDLNLGDRITSAGYQRGGNITLTTHTSALDTRAIALESFSEQGQAGNISLSAQGQLQVGVVESYGFQDGGDIRLSSTNNSVTATDTLNSVSTQGDAGNVVIQANTTIDTASIESAGSVQGGNINITSEDSDITIAGGLNSFSERGTAGSVTLRTGGRLTAREIFSEGGQQGGGVHLHGDTVDLSQGFIGSFSETGTAGSVEITAVNDITLGAAPNGTSISSDGLTRGGAVTLTSDAGNIDVDGNILSLAINGVAGNVAIQAQREVNLGGDISSQSQNRGGDITITTATSGLDTRRISLLSESGEGTAGDITLSASQTILTGDIDSEGKQRGGDISITSDRSITATRDLTSVSEQGTAGDVTLMAQNRIHVAGIHSDGDERGGNITLTTESNTIRVDDALESISLNGNAGAVTVTAAGAVATGDILSHGLQQGGHVTIQSGDRIDINTISSFSEQDTAGRVTLSAAQAVNLGGSDTTAAIRSEGQQKGGSVTISGSDITVSGALDSFSTDGIAGDVSLLAEGDIVLAQDIRTEGGQIGGDIRLETQTAGLDTTAIALESRSSQGNAGDVTLEALDSISTGAIDTEGNNRGGDIAIASNNGSIIATGQLTSLSDNDKAGSVTLTAQDGIETTDIFSQGRERGGDITLTSETGGIETNGVLASFSATGRAGAVDLTAAQSIVLAGDERTVLSRGDRRGGDIAITSETGTITTEGRLVSQSPNGIAGDVTLMAHAAITLEDGTEKNKGIWSRGRDQGGDITLTSETGRITSDGALISISDDGVAGNVTVQAANAIRIDGRSIFSLLPNWAVRSLGDSAGGDITLISQTGQVEINGQLISLSPNGTAGDVTIASQGDILLPSIDRAQVIRSQGLQRGGDVRLVSRSRRINIAGDLDSFSSDGIGGSVELLADGSIAVGNLQTFGDLESGDVAIASERGAITTGDIATIAPNGTSGSVTLTAQLNISTGDVSSTGLESGDINLTSIDGEVLTGTLSSTTGTVAIGDEVVSDGVGAIAGVSRSVVTDTGEAIAAIEQQREQEFSTYFGRDLGVETMTPEAIHDILSTVQAETGHTSAIVYVSAPHVPADRLLKQELTSAESSEHVLSEHVLSERSAHLKQSAWKQEEASLFENPLELLVFTLEGQPTRITVPDVSREQLFQTITEFRNQLVVSERRGTHSYLPVAQQLYQWLIAPLEAELGPDAVDNLLFSMDSGLRGLPIAALHDGEQFMVEKYSVGMVPSVGLMDSQYRSIANAEVLAMGADTFTQQNPLPAVPVEVDTITQLRGGTVFLNEAFTQENLTQHQAANPHRIIHLATHAAFNPGTADNSYIQLWGDERLNLNEVQNLGWHDPSVDLLVLSACQTAVGNADAEMGFAGLAVASGVRSALASLWTVSDEGTLALMAEFYDQIDNASIKSEALRQSQLAMLDGTIQINGGELHRGDQNTAIALPDEMIGWGDRDFSHPYYWSGFTMIGNPW